MIALIALALAAETPADLDLWSPEGTVGFEQAIYLRSFGPRCADLEVVDATEVPLAHACDAIGPALEGEVLRLVPDPAWPPGAAWVRLVGAEERFELGTVADIVSPATEAVPYDRTTTEGGVSYAVCHDGVLPAVVRAAGEPATVAGDALILGPSDPIAWFGTSDGRWADAEAGATGTFWFTTFDATGAMAPWTRDEVTLPAAGTLRTDLRFGGDISAGNCPSPESDWVIGDEVDVDGPEVRDPPPEDDEKKGCGGGGGAWLLLPLLFRRRYHSSTKKPSPA